MRVSSTLAAAIAMALGASCATTPPATTARATTAPATTPSGLTTLDEHAVERVRARFNAGSHLTRVLALLSPT